jgi:hypothetical protein
LREAKHGQIEAFWKRNIIAEPLKIQYLEKEAKARKNVVEKKRQMVLPKFRQRSKHSQINAS